MPKDEAALKRLGGGGWQTRDGRFTIQGDGGRWTVVDAERTDDLGLPLVRGPYGSLTDAKAAIATAREEPERASPLADRLAAAKTERSAAKPGTEARRSTKAGDADDGPSARERSRTALRHEPSAPRATGERPGRRGGAANRARNAEAEPERVVPAWLTKLAPEARARADRLLAAVDELGLDDGEAVVRRDILDDEPSVARAVLLRRLALLVDEAAGDHADRAERQRVARIVGTVAEWLTNRGREPGPRLALPGWRVVEEGEGARRIEVTRSDVERASRATGPSD